MSTLSRAVPETQLEVDLLILDYLLYMGSRTMLQEQVILREEGIRENLSEQPMRMIDCELTILGLVPNCSLTRCSIYPTLQMQSPER